MISKYRNKGILRLCLGWGLILLGFIILGATDVGQYKKLGQFTCIICGITGYLIYLCGCVDLLKAKGYDSSVFLAFLIIGFCCSLGVLFIAPLIILFAMKDKTRGSSRH